MERRAEAGDTPTHHAFISYSRKNIAFARALEKALQAYRPPHDLAVVQGYVDVFRDEEDFTGSDYPEAVRQHLSASRKLIVICSPAARASAYVNEEIRVFTAKHGAANIIPVLLAGIPNNEARPGQEAEVAFPAALCEALQMPLATSYLGFDPSRERVDRGAYDGSWYSLLANLYDISRSEVEQREKRQRARVRRRWISGTAAVMAALAALAIWALISRREAIRQRDIASAGLVTARARALEGPQTETLERRALLAVEALRRLDAADGDPREANAVLAETLSRLPQRVVVWPTEEHPPVLGFSTDGLRLFRAVAGQLESWSLKHEKVERTAPIATSISQLIPSPQGDVLAAIDAQGSVMLYSTADLSPAVLGLPEGTQAVCAAFDADGRLLATALRSTARPPEVVVWRTADHQPHARFSLPAEAVLDPENDRVPCLAFSRTRSGSSAAETLLAAHARKDEEDRFTVLARRLPPLSPEPWAQQGSNEEAPHVWSDVVSAAFATDENKLLISRDDPAHNASQLVRVDLAGWEESTLSAPGARPGPIAPDGKRFATERGGADPYVPLLHTTQSEIRDTSDGAIKVEIPSPGRFSTDGSRFLTVNGSLLRLWDLSTGREAIRVEASKPIASVIESPGGRYLVLIGEDNSSEIWATGHPQELSRIAGVAAGDLSPDGRRLTTTHGNSVELLELGTDVVLARLRLGNPSATARTAPDGSRVVLDLPQPNSFIWPSERPQPLRLVDPSAANTALWQSDIDKLDALAFSPDSAKLVVVGKDGAISTFATKDGQVLWRRDLGAAAARVQFSRDGADVIVFPSATLPRAALNAVVVLDASSGAERTRIPADDVSAIATDAAGRRLALATSSGDATNAIGVWTIEPGTRQLELALPTTLTDVAAIAFTPDGKRLVVIAGSKASTFLGASFYTEQAVLAWDLSSGAHIARIPAGEDRATDYSETLKEEEKPYLVDAVLSADGRRAAATVFPSRLSYWGVRADLAPKDAVVWDLSDTTPEEVLRVPGGEIRAISADGRVVLVSSLGALHAMTLERDHLAESACQRVERNLDPGEWLAYFGDETPRATCATSGE